MFPVCHREKSRLRDDEAIAAVTNQGMACRKTGCGKTGTELVEENLLP
jgi:hypothetical protein